MGGTGPHGIRSFQPTGAPGEGSTFTTQDGRTRFNLLGWNGQGHVPNLFPETDTR